MPTVRAIIERVRATPPRRLPARVIEVALRRVRNSKRRRIDSKQNTTISDTRFSGLLNSSGGTPPQTLSLRWPSIYGPATVQDILTDDPPAGTVGLQEIASRARDHRFDLLGSGWVEVGYQTRCAGAFGHSYEMTAGDEAEADQLAEMTRLLDETARHVKDDSAEFDDLRAAIGSGNYRPIDWHLDFKSGYRWDPRTWHMDVSIGEQGGVDIKVPWELSRGHHLVALALDAVTNNASHEENAREIALQLLDWIAANPPRFGVNWRTTMDVGIRAANWVWALSILGETPSIPPAIRWLVAKSLYQHGNHIINHLEYQADYTSNHYLANIVGLMHIGFVYPEFPESAGWLDFCIEELVSEMDRTVYPDGVNYECSTGYHRLVTEMFLHGALLTLRLSSDQKSGMASLKHGKLNTATRSRITDSRVCDMTTDVVLPGWFWLRLRRMLGYVADVTKPNGLALQFGDQDSGRFLKLSWIGRNFTGSEPEEEPRDHRHLLAIGARLFGDKNLAETGQEYELDGLVATFGVGLLPLPDPGEAPDGPLRTVSVQDTGAPESVWYPFGGTCVMRRGYFWVGIRCVPGGSKGPTGHRHNDQLSFEMSVAGEDIIVDWGTGTYTADTEIRNRFRSTVNHSTAYPRGKEQNNIVAGRDGVFVLRDRTDAECIGVEAAKFIGEHSGFGTPHRRTVSLRENTVVVEDVLEVPGGFRVSLTTAEGVKPVATDSRDSGSTVNLELGAVTIEVESSAMEATIASGSLSSGYGVFSEVWSVEFAVDHGTSCMTFRNVSRGDS